MNSKQDIRILTERFFNGETTVEEERLLYRLYQGDDVPQDLLACREMMLDMGAVDSLHPSSSQREGAAVSKANVIPLGQHRLFRWLAAAVIALAVIGGATALFMHGSEEEECVAFIYGLRVTDQTVVMEELSQTAMSMADSRGDDDVARQLDEMFNLE